MLNSDDMKLGQRVKVTECGFELEVISEPSTTYTNEENTINQ
ncbi:hypothetical protein [uncultured Methanolobus sp.]|nr:hypothetical protein [uncultured Methanolobus sp.]